MHSVDEPTGEELAALRSAEAGEGGGGMTDGGQPPYLWNDYVSTRLRAPLRPLVIVPATLSELTGPAFGDVDVAELDHDLTRQHAGAPLGERIVVSGRVTDRDGRPIRSALIEIWQANAAGRYVHDGDQHPAPLDPNFTGAGRCLTDEDGVYRFVTVKPGAYPWRNHDNAWRPAHIHLSLFGRAFTNRLVTQMYFPGRSPVRRTTRSSSRCATLRRATGSCARSTSTSTVPEWALGYRFDVVLGGPAATPLERMTLPETPSQTVGPFFSFGLCERPSADLVDDGTRIARPRLRRRGRAGAGRDGRDLAGRLRGPVPRRLRVGPLRHRRGGPVRLHDGEARASRRAGAAPGRARLRARAC